MQRLSSAVYRILSQLDRQVKPGFRTYQQAGSNKQTRAFRAVIRQLGRDRARMWAQWILAIGGHLADAHSNEQPSRFIPPPPEQPSTLVDDIAALRDEVGRELLTTWAHLGHLAYEESGPWN